MPADGCLCANRRHRDQRAVPHAWQRGALPATHRQVQPAQHTVASAAPKPSLAVALPLEVVAQQGLELVLRAVALLRLGLGVGLPRRLGASGLHGRAVKCEGLTLCAGVALLVGGWASMQAHMLRKASLPNDVVPCHPSNNLLLLRSTPPRPRPHLLVSLAAAAVAIAAAAVCLAESPLLLHVVRKDAAVAVAAGLRVATQLVRLLRVGWTQGDEG